MQDEKLSDAIIYDKLTLLKKDFFGYIERNTTKVDANLPVFYGYVISALENSFPHLADETYDGFIDDITFKVLDASRRSNDIEYIKKVLLNVIRLKKRKDADMGINIVAGLKLLKTGDCEHALEYLKNYWHLDTLIGTAVAYCYYMLSLKEPGANNGKVTIPRTGEMELLAREKLLDLARVRPPVGRLKQLELEDPAFLHTVFWQMIFLGLEWFPSEKWFIQIGLENATRINNADMRKRLLEIGSERFYTELEFLREMYNYRLENRDAGGAAGVVNQLIIQYPHELEPVFLGLKLSLLTSKKTTYHSFRKRAVANGMSMRCIGLFDFTFALFTGERPDAINHIADFEKEYPQFRYYATVLRYLAKDILSGDESRVKHAKKALFDTIEQFCSSELRKKR